MEKRIFTYLIYYLVAEPTSLQYKEHYFLGLVEALNKDQAIELSKVRWPDVQQELKAMASGGKTANKWYKGRTNWLRDGNTGFYKPKR